ncbi:MAG TPA: DUF222 domain-containing protein [Acidimicrobiia bacterium]|nr:DUF222 domain-containing protein [Acidimicrobiia bacterium]
MEWKEASNDQIDHGLDHFAGLSAAGLARVCDLIAEVDSRQSWMADGARNLTDWVAARLRLRHSSAAQLVGVSRRLADLPLLRERFAAGDLSLDQVDAISRMATPETEAEVIGAALSLSTAALDRAARRHRGISETEARSVWERRRLIRQWNLDESELRFRGRLPGAEGRIFDQAIASRVDEMGPNPESGLFDSLETRSADALIDMAATTGGIAAPTQVGIFADLEALTTDDRGTAYLDNTAPIPNSTAQRLACDATIETIIKDGNQVIGIGRRSRKIPGWLRRLVHERDGGVCQHPGCRNTRWLQVHHIIAWAHGGSTDLDNLILLCGAHHRFVHEHGWRITGPPDNRVVRRPDWTPYPHRRRPLEPRLAQLVST